MGSIAIAKLRGGNVFSFRYFLLNSFDVARNYTNLPTAAIIWTLLRYG